MDSVAEQIVAYAQERRVSAQTLARWQAWAQEDQEAFFAVVQELRLGENQLRDFLEWLEEIVLREGGTICDILTRPEITRPLRTQGSRQDKLKGVKAAVRKLRYPQLSRREEEVRQAVKALDLGSQIRVAFPPAFEGDEVTIEIKVRNAKEVGDSLVRLQQRLDQGVFQLLFDLLDRDV